MSWSLFNNSTFQLFCRYFFPLSFVSVFIYLAYMNMCYFCELNWTSLTTNSWVLGKAAIVTLFSKMAFNTVLLAVDRKLIVLKTSSQFGKRFCLHSWKPSFKLWRSREVMPYQTKKKGNWNAVDRCKRWSAGSKKSFWDCASPEFDYRKRYIIKSFRAHLNDCANWG